MRGWYGSGAKKKDSIVASGWFFHTTDCPCLNTKLMMLNQQHYSWINCGSCHEIAEASSAVLPNTFHLRLAVGDGLVIVVTTSRHPGWKRPSSVPGPPNISLTATTGKK